MLSSIRGLPLVGLFLICSAPSFAGASTFSTNCTLPTESTTLVKSANIRGTFDILWSGFFTIFICIWTVQHLNVPEQRNGRDAGWKGDLKWAWKGFFTKFKWMALTLIMPEFILAKAYAERKTARDWQIKLLSGYNGIDGTSLEVKNWTMTHTFYAEMGGFVIRPYGAQSSELRCAAAADIFVLRGRGLLETLPTISTDHLNDLSKGDFFVKAAAVGQVSWMVVQVVARASKGLPITQLEITACAFAALTFLTYLLWWEKPQAVKSITELPLSWSGAVPPMPPLDQYLHGRTFALQEVFLRVKDRKLVDNEPMPNDTISDDSFMQILLGFLIGGVVLGGVQCAAWNFEFPSHVELYFWRYSNITIVVAFPIVLCIWTVMLFLVSDFNENLSRRVFSGAAYFVTVAYLVGRIFVLFESVYSLFHLPPGAFIATWSTNIPHIA